MIVGMMGAAGALVLGFFITGSLIRLLFALGCGAAAWMLARQSSTSQKTHHLFFFYLLPVLYILLRDWVDPLMVFAHDGGFWENNGRLSGSDVAALGGSSIPGGLAAAGGSAVGSAIGGLVGGGSPPPGSTTEGPRPDPTRERDEFVKNWERLNEFDANSGGDPEVTRRIKDIRDRARTSGRLDENEVARIGADVERLAGRRRNEIDEQQQRNTEEFRERQRQQETEAEIQRRAREREIQARIDHGKKLVEQERDPERRRWLDDFLDRHTRPGEDGRSPDPAEIDRAVRAIHNHNQNQVERERDDAITEAEEADAGRKSAEGIRDWANRVNREIARHVPGGQLVHGVQTLLTDGVRGYEEGGLKGAIKRGAANLLDNYTAGAASAGLDTQVQGGGVGDFIGNWGQSRAGQFDPRTYIDKVKEARKKWNEGDFMGGLGEMVDAAQDARDAREDINRGRDSWNRRGQDRPTAGGAGDVTPPRSEPGAEPVRRPETGAGDEAGVRARPRAEEPARDTPGSEPSRTRTGADPESPGRKPAVDEDDGGARRRSEEEAARQREADAETETKRKADADAEAKRQADAETQRKADADAEAKRRTDEEAEAKRKADEEAEAKRQADAEAEAKRRADEAAEAKRKTDEEAEAKRKADAEAEAKRKADEEAQEKRKADEEADAKRKADEEAEAKRQADAEAKRKADEEAETRRKADEERDARRKAEEEAESQRRAEEEARERREAIKARHDEILERMRNEGEPIAGAVDTPETRRILSNLTELRRRIEALEKMPGDTSEERAALREEMKRGYQAMDKAITAEEARIEAQRKTDRLADIERERERLKEEATRARERKDIEEQARIQERRRELTDEERTLRRTAPPKEMDLKRPDEPSASRPIPGYTAEEQGRMRELARQIPGLEGGFVFGSTARAALDPNVKPNDLDLGVVVDKVTPQALAARDKMAQTLERELGKKVDVKLVNKADYLRDHQENIGRDGKPNPKIDLF
jgi:predicted nucleotidyltransferase